MRTFLLNGTARQATHSVVAGKPVLSDYRIPGVALDVFRDRAQGLFERMREAYSARDLQRRPTAALFPPTYPDFDETCS